MGFGDDDDDLFGSFDDDDNNTDSLSKDDLNGMKSSKKGTIFLVDCSPEMFQKKDNEETSPFQKAMEIALLLMRKRIITDSGTASSLIGIVFFGTEKHENDQGLKNVYEFQKLGGISVERIQAIKSLIENDKDSFLEKYGLGQVASTDSALERGLWNCSFSFSAAKLKQFDDQRVWIFTTDDAPHKGDDDLKVKISKRMEDLMSSNQKLQLWPLGDSNSFDADKFFAPILNKQLPENAEGGHDLDDDDSDQVGDLIIWTHNVQRENLQTFIKKKDFPRRRLAPITIQLGNNVNFGMDLFPLYMKQGPPSKIKMDAKTLQVLNTATKYFCEDSMMNSAGLLSSGVNFAAPAQPPTNNPSTTTVAAANNSGAAAEEDDDSAGVSFSSSTQQSVNISSSSTQQNFENDFGESGGTSGIGMKMQLTPDQISPYFQYGVNNRVILTVEEVKRLKSFNLSHSMQCLGFKPKSFLKPWYTIRTSYFMVPSERAIEGSTKVFMSLLKAMIEKDVIMLTTGVVRASEPVKFMALIPQPEREVDGQLVDSAGFHCVILPWANDIRKLKLMPVEPKANRDQIDSAKALLHSLQLEDGEDGKFQLFQNPAIQKHFAYLEAIALNEEKSTWDDNQDETLPPDDAFEDPSIKLKLADFMDRYGGPEDEEKVKEAEKLMKKRAAGTPISKPRKKAKTDSSGPPANWRKAADDEKLSKYKVAELKAICESLSIGTTGRKADLIDRINEKLFE